jgi:hypothetical protein
LSPENGVEVPKPWNFMPSVHGNKCLLLKGVFQNVDEFGGGFLLFWGRRL